MNTVTTRYSTVGLILHWLTAILVVIAFIYGPGGSEARVYAAGRDADRQLHETLGMIVLVLAVLRILWRANAVVPQEPPAARWMTLSAKIVQRGLYVLLLAVPLTAIAGAWLTGHPLTLLGGINLNSLVSESHSVGASIAELHGWLGDVILWLAGLHAVAALYHHLILKDGVLASMMPRWLVRSKATKD